MHWILACVAGAGAGYGQRRESPLAAFEDSRDDRGELESPGYEAARNRARARELRQQRDLEQRGLEQVPEWQVPDGRLPSDYGNRYASYGAPAQRRHAEVHADGSIVSFVEQAQQALASLGLAEAPAGEEAEELPEGEGAPSDGYEKCASAGETCSCDEGEVRMGNRETARFTHPVMMGEAKEIDCTRADMLDLQFSDPEPESGAACFCNERMVHVQVDLGAATSLAEARGDDETASDKDKLCLVPTKPSTSALVQEREAEQRALNRALLLEDAAAENQFAAGLHECEAASDDDKTWVYLLGTGQLKHASTGQCLTAVFPTNPQQPQGGEQRKVEIKACTLEDSQIESQRWEVPFYLGGESGFEYGSGKIKLAYGAHGYHSLCLTNDQTHLLIEDCTIEGGVTEFALSAVGGKAHRWEVCAEPGADCQCVGDVKYGSSDTKEYSSEISMQDPGSGTIQCSPSELREKGLWNDASTLSGDGAECQCRHDPFMDGEGSALDAAAKKLKDKNPGTGDNKAAIIGGLGFVILVGGGFVMYKRKQAWAALGEEEEEEYEEEEEEEEYEE